MGFRLFKTTYKDRRGETREAAKWYVEFRDHLDTVRRLPAFTSKSASEEFGRNLVKLVAYHKATGGQVDPSLTRWLTGLPQSVREKLVAIGLLDAQRVAVSKCLTDHLDDFAAVLTAKGNVARYVTTSKGRITRVLTGCGFQFIADISPAKVLTFLNGLKAGTEGEPGISDQTHNYYLTAFKGFCRWLVRERRMIENPVAHLDGIAVTGRRHDRRPLGCEEIAALLRATLDSRTPFRGLTGRDRHALYLTAMSTGLRAAELGSLTPESFNLGGDPPTVTVRAGYLSRRGVPFVVQGPEAVKLRKVYSSSRPKTRGSGRNSRTTMHVAAWAKTLIMKYS
jgi:site-specific recombinase XerC